MAELIWPEEKTQALVEESKKRNLGHHRIGYTWYYLDKINRGDARLPLPVIEIAHDVLRIPYAKLFQVRRERLDAGKPPEPEEVQTEPRREVGLGEN